MGFFRKKKREPKKFSKEELKRREEDIPVFKSKKKKSPFEQMDDDSLLFQDAINKPIPASIEYSLAKREKKSKEKIFEAPQPAPLVEEPEEVIVPKETQEKKEGEVSSAETVEEEKEPIVAPEESVVEDESIEEVKRQETATDEHTAKKVPDLDRMLFEQISNAKSTKKKKESPKTLEELSRQYSEEQIDEFSKASLADEADIDELEKKHMNFYSLLSKIQETHVASDFKTAYDIQDRISYLLNHRTLLYKSLVSELLIYLDSIAEKMEKYHAEISEKQQKFNRYNRKVSEIKKYKFKTDESIKIMERGQEVARGEMELQKKNAEETP